MSATIACAKVIPGCAAIIAAKCARREVLAALLPGVEIVVMGKQYYTPTGTQAKSSTFFLG
jgi:hypothetical protein